MSGFQERVCTGKIRQEHYHTYEFSDGSVLRADRYDTDRAQVKLSIGN